MNDWDNHLLLPTCSAGKRRSPPTGRCAYPPSRWEGLLVILLDGAIALVSKESKRDHHVLRTRPKDPMDDDTVLTFVIVSN